MTRFLLLLKGYLSFSERYMKGIHFCQNGLQKDIKGLDLRVEPPYVKHCRIPLIYTYQYLA